MIGFAVGIIAGRTVAASISGLAAGAQSTQQCTCQEMSKPTENLRNLGPLGSFFGLFIRHMWWLDTINGDVHDIAGHRDDNPSSPMHGMLIATDDGPNRGDTQRFQDDVNHSRKIGQPSHDCSKAQGLIGWVGNFQPRPYRFFPGPNSNGAHRDAANYSGLGTTAHFPFFGTQAPGWFYGVGAGTRRSDPGGNP
jgi:hypothetical protein